MKKTKAAMAGLIVILFLSMIRVASAEDKSIGIKSIT
jgi:hypothetical protein